VLLSSAGLSWAASLSFALGWCLFEPAGSLYNPIWMILLVAIAVFFAGLRVCQRVGQRFGADDLEIRWWIVELWVLCVVVLVVMSYVYWLLTVLVLVAVAAVFLIWRRYPSSAETTWRGREQASGAPRWRISRSVWVLATESVAIFVAAAAWSVEFVPPLQVELHSAALGRAARCAVAPKRACMLTSSVNVPGLGTIPSTDVTDTAGAVQLGVNSGYLYTVAPPDVRNIDEECFRHLYGPWWEFRALNQMSETGCPWGFSFYFWAGPP
jgi:hypothetical protein